MGKKISKIVVSGIIGFVIFLILLGIANYLTRYISIDFYADIVLFFNDNLLILSILFILGILSEIFWALFFPFNLIAPVTSAIFWVYILTFIYRFWIFLDYYAETGIIFPIDILYKAVFLLVLFVGYIIILARLEYKEEKESLEKKKEKEETEKEVKKVEWKDIGSEFKLALYNLGRALNRAFSGKKQ